MKITTKLAFIVLAAISCTGLKSENMEKTITYNVSRLTQSMQIDGIWDKTQWQNVQPIEIVNYMGELPKFRPVAQAKMMYDDMFLYVIFQIQDCFVRCLTKDINGPVWEDACAEFFFAPDTSNPMRYFNLEMNCGGTPLMHYNLVPRKETIPIEPEDIRKIEIAHTLPKVIDPETTDPVTWILEYKIPLELLEKYAPVTRPKKGIVWKANFYKIAENNSNPHYITWSVVKNENPDFHLPQYFGTIVFE
jgi:hypothetical protein